MHPALLDDNLVLPRAHDPENSFHIKMAIADTGEIRIALQIVHPVGIDLAGNQADDLLIPVSLRNHVGYILRKILPGS
ncbi:Uncharacterised protein [Mycobacteroides abscessus subsp. abscessus]|nr:Uncharacterised protein [Mycobacteroides abscessus subsp. abscessus]